MSTTFRILLLAGLVICAVATALVRKPMRAVIIYMAYSIIMSVVWLLLESPDLAITEAAVGAGITGILFFLTLRRIDLIDKDAEHEARREEEPHDETLLTLSGAAVAFRRAGPVRAAAEGSPPAPGGGRRPPPRPPAGYGRVQPGHPPLPAAV